MSKVGKIGILLCAFFIASCNSVSNSTIYHYNKDAKYALLEVDDAGFMKERPTTYFYDENGKEVDKVKSDAAYSYGPGGLLKIDLEKHKVKKLVSKGNVNYIAYDDNNHLYYYNNIGIPKGETEYKSQICKFEGECFDFKLPINSFEIKGNLLYIFFITGIGDNSRESYFVTIDMITKQEIHRELKDIYSTMFKSNNKIYFADQKHIYALDGSFDYQYENEKHQLYYDDSYIYVAYPYQEDQIILMNITTNKALITIKEDNFNFVIDEKTQSVIQHFYKENYFIDHSTKLRVATPNKKQYNLFYLK